MLHPVPSLRTFPRTLIVAGVASLAPVLRKLINQVPEVTFSTSYSWFVAGCERLSLRSS